MNQLLLKEIPVYVQEFLRHIQVKKGASLKTVEDYFYELRLFLRLYKKNKSHLPSESGLDNIDILDIQLKDLENLKTTELTEYLAYIKPLKQDNPKANKKSITNDADRAPAKRTKSKRLACLKSFFNYLEITAELITRNPTRKESHIKLDKREVKYLTDEESIKLLSVIKGEHHQRDYAIITLFLVCALRLSELVGINLSHIQNNVLTVIGKGDKERKIPLSASCTRAIDSYKRVRPKSTQDKDALFLSERLQRISKKTVQYMVKKYIAAAGLDVKKYSTHKLRHTAATLMYLHGNKDLRALQELLGHEDISTTQVYTHIRDKEKRDLINSNPLA